MTIYDILSSSQYPQKSVVKLLIQDILDITAEDLVLQMDDVLSDSQYQKFQDMYHQYAVQHKPLEYIIGHVKFFGHRFQVNAETLIPRAETEYMVQAVCEYSQDIQHSQYVSLRDIGTGCGVLASSVLLQNPGHFQEVTLTDISSSALEVARHNYQQLIDTQDYDTRFIQSSLLDFLADDPKIYSHVILVANLPYIPDETFDTQVSDTVRLREPRMAFVGGNDGLTYYYQLLDQIIDYRLQGKISSIVCFCEMMTWQLELLQAKYEDKFIFQIHTTFHFNIIIVQIHPR